MQAAIDLSDAAEASATTIPRFTVQIQHYYNREIFVAPKYDHAWALLKAGRDLGLLISPTDWDDLPKYGCTFKLQLEKLRVTFEA